MSPEPIFDGQSIAMIVTISSVLSIVIEFAVALEELPSRVSHLFQLSSACEPARRGMMSS